MQFLYPVNNVLRIFLKDQVKSQALTYPAINTTDKSKHSKLTIIKIVSLLFIHKSTYFLIKNN